MSAARELFLDVGPLPIPAGDEAYDKLSRAADLWRRDGQHFSAGVAMLRASRAAWGRPDRMQAAHRAGCADFGLVNTEESARSPASIAALYKLRQSFYPASFPFDIDRAVISSRVRELSSELGQRLFKYFRVR